MRSAFLAWMGCGLLLSGCTTFLETSKPATGISKGFSYELPRLAYDAEVKRTLTRCPDSADQQIRFDVTATAANRLGPGEVVVVDYMAAANGLKTTDFGMTKHPNGMLKTVNLTIDERTADFIKEGVKAAVGIGKIAIGLPGGGAVAANPKYDGPVAYLRCSGAARTSLLALPGLKAKIKPAEEASKEAAKAYEELLTASKNGKPAPAKDLAAAAKLARDKADVLEKAKKAHDEETAKLVLLHRLPLDLPDGGRDEILKLEAARDAKPQPASLFEIYYPTTPGRHFLIPLTATLQPDVAKATPVGYPAGDAAIETDLAKLAAANYTTILSQLGLANVAVSAYPLGASKAADDLPNSESCAKDAGGCGVLYRTAASGRMRICSGASGDPATAIAACRARITGDPAILFHEERLVPQFGQLMSLPLKNGPFMNNTLAASFTEDGRVTDFSYKKPTAEAVAALASVNEGIGGVTELITYKNGRELQRLKDKKAVLDQQLANKDVTDKLTTSELEALKDQKDLVEQQILLADANARAQPKPAEVTQTENEVLLLDARINKAKKDLELKKLLKEIEDLDKPKDEEEDDDGGA